MPSNTENFSKNINNVFVETGSFMGDGVQQAIDAGFKKIISIELSEKYYKISSDRFSSNPNVTIIKGDSYKVLLDAIKDIDDKITFWLDGHHSCGDTALGDFWAPLMQELKVIKDHHRKDHTILIDDMRCWQEPNPVHGFFIDDIYKELYEINKDYKIEFLDGVEPMDILVAKIK